MVHQKELLVLTTNSGIGEACCRPFGKPVFVVDKTIRYCKMRPEKSAQRILCKPIPPGTQVYTPIDRSIPGWFGIIINAKKVWFEASRFVDATPLQVLSPITRTYTKPDAESPTYPCNIANGMVVFVIGKWVDTQGTKWVKLQGHGTWVMCQTHFC
jgi:hypothetical protein